MRIVLFSVLAAVAAVCLPVCTVAAQAQGQPHGHFRGTFVAEWLPDNRNMRLKEPVAYVAPDREVWEAPAGLVTDGASIPWPLWSFIGAPFSGEYRNAAVIHDHYCDTRSRPWREVHKTFYLASLAGGTPEAKAKTMYFAVYRFGPRWERARTGDPSEIVFKPKLVASEFEAMQARIEREGIGLEEIERSADRSLRSLSRAIIE